MTIRRPATTTDHTFGRGCHLLARSAGTWRGHRGPGGLSPGTVRTGGQQTVHAMPPRSSITTAATVNIRRRRYARDRPDGTEAPGSQTRTRRGRSIRNQSEQRPRGSRGRPVGRCAGNAAILGVEASLRECTRERWPWARWALAAYGSQPAGDSG